MYRPGLRSSEACQRKRLRGRLASRAVLGRRQQSKAGVHLPDSCCGALGQACRAARAVAQQAGQMVSKADESRLTHTRSTHGEGCRWRSPCWSCAPV